MPALPDEVIDDLKALIKRCGTQAKAAEAMGVSQSYISAVLHGRHAPSDRVAAFLGWQRRVVISEEGPYWRKSIKWERHRATNIKS
jgi:transcriptional regulator with XRE-family HTH domain